MGSNNHWLNGAVLYQIYPRSFYDSNGDGVGDIPGITEKLDHLKGADESLGVDYIWISPFYPSPMADFGYDVSNYMDVDPLFGTLDDFRELLRAAHARDLKVLVDFIPNHTSDQHAWFKESRSSRDNPKRDWYVWKDPIADGGVPNNWLSVFGGPTWTLDEATGQYYLHSFLNKQPDLNWDNPDVRDAMHQQMKFWLDMGVDGFRVDAVSWISKDPEFRDEEINKAYAHEGTDPHNALVHTYSQNGPKLYDYLNEMANLVADYGGVMITEAYPQDWTDVSVYRRFYDHVNAEVSAPFNFGGISSAWNADSFRNFIDAFQNSLKPTDLAVYCFGNHDKSRLASRIGGEASKTAATLLLTLPGMPTIYYGDELGLKDVTITPDQVQDPFEKNVPGQGLGRDPERTPMPWDDTLHAGFSSTEPWLPIGEENAKKHIAAQQVNPHSHLSIYKTLLRLRADSPALQEGDYTSLDSPVGIHGFVRSHEDETLYVLLNFTSDTIPFDGEFPQGKTIFSTYGDAGKPVTGHIVLQPHEGVIIRQY